MNAPRILPLAGVAIAGVLAIKALSGVTHLPDLVEGAKAFAEGVAPAKTQDAGAKGDANAPVLPPGLTPKAAPRPGSPEAVAAAANGAPQTPRLACGPNPAELAHDAGLSPAELQVLQSLSARRGQLDQRQQDLDVQLQLLTAAETKLDAKLQALASMKADLQKLLDDADQKKVGEIDRLVTVYSQMKPKDAAARMSLLDDSVRLPIAAKMKERALSAILAQMAPADAKAITEKLAGRFESKLLTDARSAISGQPAAGAAPTAQAAATPQAPAATPAAAAAPPQAKPARVAKARPHARKPKAAALAANTATDQTAKPAAAPAAGPSAASAKPAAPTTPAKTG
jgi:flagellar motility protein MotE (MotC chaperone)